METMKKRGGPKTILFAAVAAGAVSWVLNGALDWCFFGGCDVAFREALFSMLPAEIYDRSVTFLVFLAFGAYAYRSARRHEESQRHLADAKTLLEIANQGLSQANADLEHFAHAAAHDLREPLVISCGHLRRLEKQVRDTPCEETKKSLDHTRNALLRMERLILDLAAFSGSFGPCNLDQDVNCNDELEKAVANLFSPIHRRKATVTRGCLPTVAGNRTMICLVLQNLIGNAVKFCRDGTPQVHVSCETTGKEHVFTVEDNGIGVDPDRAEDIFRAFTRLHNRKEYPGSGIGLATCRRIVERHGGRIWAQPGPVEGSLFRFTLPAQGVQDQKQATKAEKTPQGKAGQKHCLPDGLPA